MTYTPSSDLRLESDQIDALLLDELRSIVSVRLDSKIENLSEQLQALETTVYKDREAIVDRICDVLSKDKPDYLPVKQEITASVLQSFSSKPEEVVKIISPHLGVLISKVVLEKMKEFTEYVNQRIEKTFSFQRLLWRWEAKKYGVSIGEWALYRSNPFKLKKAVLVDVTKGLLVSSCAEDNEATDQDAQFATVFDAVDRFVKSSISAVDQDSSEPSTSIHKIQGRRFEIRTIASEKFKLILLVQGSLPSDLEPEFRQKLSEMQHALSRSKDEQGYEPLHSIMASLKTIQPSKEMKSFLKKNLKAICLLGVLFSLIAFAFGSECNKRWSDWQLINAYVSKVKSTPGLNFSELSTDEFTLKRILVVEKDALMGLDEIPELPKLERGIIELKHVDVDLLPYGERIKRTLKKMLPSGLAGELDEKSKKLTFQGTASVQVFAKSGILQQSLFRDLTINLEQIKSEEERHFLETASELESILINELDKNDFYAESVRLYKKLERLSRKLQINFFVSMLGPVSAKGKISPFAGKLNWILQKEGIIKYRPFRLEWFSKKDFAAIRGNRTLQSFYFKVVHEEVPPFKEIML